MKLSSGGYKKSGFYLYTILLMVLILFMIIYGSILIKEKERENTGIVMVVFGVFVLCLMMWLFYISSNKYKKNKRRLRRK
jgi:MFS-type transporter involved in bile tolerance (Atg22 family)